MIGSGPTLSKAKHKWFKLVQTWWIDRIDQAGIHALKAAECEGRTKAR